MRSAKFSVDFDDLLISASYGDNEYENVQVFEEMYPYIKRLSIDLALEREDGALCISVYGDKEKAEPAGCLAGNLILGTQVFRDGTDFVSVCDECDGELCVIATDLEDDGLLEDFLSVAFRELNHSF